MARRTGDRQPASVPKHGGCPARLILSDEPDQEEPELRLLGWVVRPRAADRLAETRSSLLDHDAFEVSARIAGRQPVAAVLHRQGKYRSAASDST
jgi:hypothetical protein